MATFSQSDFNSKNYGSCRPTYKTILFEKIYNYHRDHKCEFTTALDIATGTGQVAEPLSNVFHKVYATDPSQTMLNSATKKSNIEYSIASAENLSNFANDSIDLITIAQALHWVNVEKFFAEAYRVLKPNGTLAIWGYVYIIIRGYPKATQMIEEWGTSKDKLATYWESGRRVVEDYYKGVKVPPNLFGKVKWEFYPTVKRQIEEDECVVEVKDPNMEATYTIDNLRMYLKTSSCYKNYMTKNPNSNDPVDELIDQIKEVEGWKDDQLLNVVWPTIFILASKRT
ncbi:1333_t:CDS:2 [Ambispora leptoticha]|uniref:1333_t:CDS:1 n=1 Tax=Ambispora leptoticha TaxID=144679 RepID=A0A9N8V197_9GLOM|nr:1333_t:CDS:2 [Ambispora leptoticha]